MAFSARTWGGSAKKRCHLMMWMDVEMAHEEAEGRHWGVREMGCCDSGRRKPREYPVMGRGSWLQESVPHV